jgi:hypothetical protein
MDSENKVEDKNKKVEVQKKKNDTKKPGKRSGPKEPRDRAKSTLVNPFDSKKPVNSKKETKPVETIGENRFKNLLSMFDKKSGPAKENKEDPGPMKLDMNKFSAFNIDNSNDKHRSSMDIRPSGASSTIKERMEALLNSNKTNNKNSVSTIDPVLEQRRKLKDQDEHNNDSFDEDDFSYDDHISMEEKDIKERDEDSSGDSDSEIKNPKNENKDINSKKKEEEEDHHEHDDGDSNSDSDNDNDNDSDDYSNNKDHIKEESKPAEEQNSKADDTLATINSLLIDGKIESSEYPSHSTAVAEEVKES